MSDEPQDSASQDEEESTYSFPDHEYLSGLPDGTEVRHWFNQDDTVSATIDGDYVRYKGEKLSPSRAASEAVREKKGAGYEVNGWIFWRYFDEETGEWLQLDVLRNS